MTDDTALAADASLAARIEAAEVRAWRDMYAAIPDDYRRRYAPEIGDVAGVTCTRCAAIPFSHFNAVLTLGAPEEPAAEAQLDAVLAWYRDAGIARAPMVPLGPHARPAALAGWLAARGLRARGSWDRVYRPDGALPPPLPAPDGAAELVTAATADEWAAFLSGTYRLPTQAWLASLVGRPGWTHAVLRRGAEGRIVAARTLYAEAGWGWLGVEAPVPGLMAPSWADDRVLVDALLRDGAARGVERFVADVEAPSPARDTPAYADWARAGFAVAYARTLFG